MASEESTAPSVSKEPLTTTTSNHLFNHMGWMSTGPADQYITDFVQYAATADGLIADLGCGTGHNTKLLLQAGTKSVLANDIKEDYLKTLYKSLTEEETERAVALHGSALTLTKVIKPGTLGGILCANLLHFLQPAQVRNAFKMFYDLLKPNGELCVTAFSTHCGLYTGKRNLQEKRQAVEEEWPGQQTEKQKKSGETEGVCQLFLDPEDFAREAKLAGFVVKMCGYISRPEYPRDFEVDGQPGESAGLIAVKHVI